MYNILITGSISFSNKGTLAILISTIEGIKNNMPDSKIFIEVFYPNIQKKIYSMNEDIEIVPVFLQNPLKNIKTILKSDFIIDVSAEAFVSYYDDDAFQKFQRYAIHLIPLFLSMVFKKKFVLFSQTFGPFGGYKTIIKSVLNKSSFITLRDENSLEHVINVIDNKDKIYLTSDPAFLLKSSNNHQINDIFSREKIDFEKIRLTNKYIIGISAARTTGRKLSQSEYQQIIAKFSYLIDELIKKYDCHIIFIPHSSGKISNSNDDVLVGKDILKKIIQKDKFNIIKGDYSPQDLKGIISKCDFLISHRMHPAIAAITSNVPVILLAFNNKAYGLMKKFNMEKYVCHIDNFKSENILNLFDDLIENRNEIKRTFIIKNHEIQKTILLSFKKILTL